MRTHGKPMLVKSIKELLTKLGAKIEIHTTDSIKEEVYTLGGKTYVFISGVKKEREDNTK